MARLALSAAQAKTAGKMSRPARTAAIGNLMPDCAWMSARNREPDICEFSPRASVQDTCKNGQVSHICLNPGNDPGHAGRFALFRSRRYFFTFAPLRANPQGLFRRTLKRSAKSFD